MKKKLRNPGQCTNKIIHVYLDQATNKAVFVVNSVDYFKHSETWTMRFTADQIIKLGMDNLKAALMGDF